MKQIIPRLKSLGQKLKRGPATTPVVIFDFDGTLANTLPVLVKEVNANAERYGYKPIADPAKLKDKDAFQILTKEMKIPLWKLPYIVWRARKLALSKLKIVEVFPETKELVHEIKKLAKVMILTSNNEMVVKHVLKKAGIHIPGIYCSGIFNKHRALRRMMRKYHLAKAHVVYVGDEIRDVKACRRAGIKMIGVSWGYNSIESLQEAGADHIVKDYQELITLIRKLNRTS